MSALLTIANTLASIGDLRRQFWNLTVTGLVLGSIYALVALGYTLVYGVLRLINFANSEVFMVGTFGALLASAQVLNIPFVEDGQYPYRTGLTLLAILAFLLVVAMIVSAATSIVLERAAYRPLRGAGDIYGAVIAAFLTGFVLSLLFLDRPLHQLILGLVLTGPITFLYRRLFQRDRKAPRLAFLISAIGASTAMSEAVGVYAGKVRNQGGLRNQFATPRVLEKQRLFSFLGADVRVDHVLVVGAALVMMVGLTLFVKRTRLGRGVRAVAQDTETARIMGVNVDQVILVTFLLGGLMAGGAALLFTVLYDQTRNNIGFLLGVKSFTAAVLGGIGNLQGALFGGLLLGLVENYGSAIFGGQWKDVIAFSVLLIVLMFRPTGLLGETLGRARA